MTKVQFVNTLTRSFHKVGFQLKKHSPEIMVVAGVIGTVASAVMACRATTKIEGVLEETRNNVEMVHKGVEAGKVYSKDEKGDLVPVPYTEEDGKKDLTIYYAKTAVEFGKLYGPSVILGVASIACILGGHHILRKRNLALAAAYATEQLGFKEYRSRVIERFGKELDKELKYNIKAKEIEETVVNEDGTEQTVTRTVQYADPNEHSSYARFFDEACAGWQKDSEYNLLFLRHQQNYANEKLKAEGFLFLNDVYEMLDIPKTKAGQLVGWIYDEKNPIGDNYVDFGIYDVTDPCKRRFVNGDERNILLDFNVDGNIWEMM